MRRGALQFGDGSPKPDGGSCTREKVFTAVIDDVEVKRASQLSPRDIEHDNPEFRRHDEMQQFLEQIYGRPVAADDVVTVVRFSQIVENPPGMTDRIRGFGGAQN